MYVTFNATLQVREENNTILTELKTTKLKLQGFSMCIAVVVISLISFARTQIVTIQKGSRHQLQEDNRNGIRDKIQKQALKETLKQDSEEVKYLMQAKKVSLSIYKCIRYHILPCFVLYSKYH
jgi:hypothetical protein